MSIRCSQVLTWDTLCPMKMLQYQNTISMENRFGETYNLIHSVLMYDLLSAAAAYHLDHRTAEVVRITDKCITINRDVFIGRSVYTPTFPFFTVWITYCML